MITSESTSSYPITAHSDNTFHYSLFLDVAGYGGCIRETNVKEYQLFELQSNALKSIVSRQLTDNMLVGGVPGSKNLQQLQFCVVTSDTECSPSFTSDCIRRDKDYRFRVGGPIQGYLHIEGSVIRIVRDYYQASVLTLYGEAGWGLRVEQVHCGGTRSVFATTQPGAPIRLEHPQSNNANQWFKFLEVNDFNNFECKCGFVLLYHLIIAPDSQNI